MSKVKVNVTRWAQDIIRVHRKAQGVVTRVLDSDGCLVVRAEDNQGEAIAEFDTGLPGDADISEAELVARTLASELTRLGFPASYQEE